MPKSPPNIVLITTDQHRADCYSFARPDIKTPHIDQLAAGGTRFDRCYCPGPLCQPARASILTGMLPFSHGVRDNGIDLPDDMIDSGFAAQASKLGYQSALLGKAHLSTQHTFSATGRGRNAATPWRSTTNTGTALTWASIMLSCLLMGR